MLTFLQSHRTFAIYKQNSGIEPAYDNAFHNHQYAPEYYNDQNGRVYGS